MRVQLGQAEAVVFIPIELPLVVVNLLQISLNYFFMEVGIQLFKLVLHEDVQVTILKLWKQVVLLHEMDQHENDGRVFDCKLLVLHHLVSFIESFNSRLEN